ILTSAECIEALKKLLGIDVDFITLTKIWDSAINIPCTTVSGYKNGMLYISVQTSSAQMEINYRKTQIIKIINQYLASDKIKKIKVSIGK
ncbi:MAG: DUF721 domain-containing protein, partial [Elusimicrobiota bacterium]|nr:DUF721 domain-containing protein [Elusimicrobiota bacterium]